MAHVGCPYLRVFRTMQDRVVMISAHLPSSRRRLWLEILTLLPGLQRQNAWRTFAWQGHRPLDLGLWIFQGAAHGVIVEG